VWVKNPRLSRLRPYMNDTIGMMRLATGSIDRQAEDVA